MLLKRGSASPRTASVKYRHKRFSLLPFPEQSFECQDAHVAAPIHNLLELFIGVKSTVINRLKIQQIDDENCREGAMKKVTVWPSATFKLA